MRPLLLIVAILLGCLTLVWCFNQAKAQQLYTLGSQGPALQAGDPLNTQPFSCGQNTAAYASVDFTMPYSAHLVMVKFFTGAWGKTVADIGVKLWDVTSGQSIFYTNQDRYTDPSGKQSPDTWQAPAGTFVQLNQGDDIRLDAYCSSYNAQLPQWLDITHILPNLYYFTFPTKAHASATLYVTR